MTSAFLYLTLCTTRNRWRVRLRRLRQPRYAVGMVAGALYFYFVFFAPRRGGGGGASGFLAASARFPGALELGGVLMLFLGAALAWVWPRSSAILRFTRSEVQFLFPAPITRRQLVQYCIVRALLANVLFSALMTLIFRPDRFAAGWTVFAGMTVMVSTFTLHLMGVSLSRASLASHGLAGLARQWVPAGAVLAAVVVLASAVIGQWARVSAPESIGGVLRVLVDLGNTGMASVVLWPFRALVRLPLVDSSEAFLGALPAAIGLFAVNYLWVLRSDAAFEEASAEAAEKIALARGRLSLPASKAGVRRSRVPFTLAVEGRPEVALFWKNLILTGRYASLRTLARLLPVVIGVGVVFAMTSRRGGPGTLAILAIVMAALTVLFGPQMARNDLRQDLMHLAVLKTWPMRGAAMLRGEILAPAAVLSAALGIFVVAALALSTGDRVLSRLPWTARGSYALSAMTVGPALILTQLVLQNGLAVLFPAWVATGRSRSAGFDVMGQRLLMLYGMILVVAVAAIPGVLVGAAIGATIYAATGVVPVLLPALGGAMALVAECWLATAALGRVLDRTDVSAVDATEA